MTADVQILDYGMGNLRSVERAIARLGFTSERVETPQSPQRLIIPGVGAFGAAMERLGPLKDSLRGLVADGVPLLGICLGQQLLFDESEEFGRYEGLGLIPGRVRYLPAAPGAKVPHIGWTEAKFRPDAVMREEGQVYFVHSLYTECAEEADIAATADHALTFPAAVQRGRVYGVQFHPEKSGAVGLSMLKRFMQCG